MDPASILIVSEFVKILLSGYLEAVRQSNMTEEEKEAHFKTISDTFEKYAPDNLTPAP